MKNSIKKLIAQRKKFSRKSKYFINKPILILLSGGASSRFGCDKMLWCNQRKVWAYNALAKRLAPAFELYECAKNKRLNYTGFIQDEFSDFSAASALKSVAKFAHNLADLQIVILLAGDYFCAKRADFKPLLRSVYKDKKSAAYKGADRKNHVFFAAYLAKDLKKAINLDNNARINDFLDRLDASLLKKTKRTKSLRNFNFMPNHY